MKWQTCVRKTLTPLALDAVYVSARRLCKLTVVAMPRTVMTVCVAQAWGACCWLDRAGQLQLSKWRVP